MKYRMKKYVQRMVMVVAVCMTGMYVQAVPAYPGWQSKTQADGSTIRVRLLGDEYYHYWETSDGKLAVEQADGTFLVSEQSVPTREEFQKRRSKARSQRRSKSVGSVNLAPKGVVILVNFQDCAMNNAHTHTTFNNMCNSTNCTTNRYKGVNYGSAAQYFSDQSNGAYRPQFDVFGPVTLPHPVAYYGEQGMLGDEEQNDLYMADFVIDAVLAAEEAGCDFSQYDSDGDEWVDFVYFIYAGKGQASGGSSETIWPHNWNLINALYYGFTHGTSDYYVTDDDWNVLVVDEVGIYSYACSAELDYNGELGGIGTLCHEFGHVMGLPDFYDTEYGSNYDNYLTPNDWDVMDGGAYNGDSHCPPNYNPWEKYFFGWVSSVNLGDQSSTNTLYANGTSNYNVYQVNASGQLQTATTTGLNYYLENRQQSGWDTFLPSHGMVIWRVDYDENRWQSNTPNSVEGDIRFSVVCSSGTMVGTVWEYDEYAGDYILLNDGSNNVFGEASGVTYWDGVSGKPVSKISESGSVVTFQYKSGTQENWYYYDDGTYSTSIGNGNNPFWWGIMLPAGTIQSVDPKLTHIAIAEMEDYNTQPIDIAIYSGGAIPQESNKIYTQTVEPEAANTWHVVALDHPVSIDKNKNLWITLSEGTDSYPALVSEDTGDPNGRWVSVDGIEWFDLADAGDNLNYTFMVRAYIEGLTNEDIETVESDKSAVGGHKILQNGQLFILRDGKIYNILGTIIK